MTAEPRCAFDACQAGGVILPGANWIDVYDHDQVPHRYHPGCWAAAKQSTTEEAPCRS